MLIIFIDRDLFPSHLVFLPPQQAETQQTNLQHFCVGLIIDFWAEGTAGNPQICMMPLSARCTVRISLNYVKDI